MKGMKNLCLQSIAGKHRGCSAGWAGEQGGGHTEQPGPSSPPPGSAGAALGNHSQEMGRFHRAPLAYASQSSKRHTEITEPNTGKYKNHRNIPNSFSSKHSWQASHRAGGSVAPEHCEGPRVCLRTAAALSARPAFTASVG